MDIFHYRVITKVTIIEQKYMEIHLFVLEYFHNAICRYSYIGVLTYCYIVVF